MVTARKDEIPAHTRQAMPTSASAADSAREGARAHTQQRARVEARADKGARAHPGADTPHRARHPLPQHSASQHAWAQRSAITVSRASADPPSSERARALASRSD